MQQQEGQGQRQRQRQMRDPEPDHLFKGIYIGNEHFLVDHLECIHFTVEAR